MFDIGFWELSLIAVIALLILGPERLPRVARTAGLWVGKMKKMVSDVKSNIDEELRMEELKALKQAGEDIKQGLSTTEKELTDVGTEFKSTVEEASIETEDVDIVSAINESAPKAETAQPEAVSDTTLDSMPADNVDTVKKKIKKKAKRKAKKKAGADGKTVAKKSTKKASTSSKSDTKVGETKKSRKKKTPVQSTNSESAVTRQPQEQQPASSRNPQDQGI